MKGLPVILIFDVGKTNKKILLFDETYKLVYEESIRLDETIDETGFPCEDVDLLTSWIRTSFEKIALNKDFEIRAANFSGYGASFVNVDESLRPVLPLCNYLKPYPEHLQKKFYDSYGGEEIFSRICASPVLGSLNSGMQLYRAKNEQPEQFKKIKYALHFPQYLSSILTGIAFSEITSIGCHTNLWDFSINDYHSWVKEEGIEPKFAPIQRSDSSIPIKIDHQSYCVGIGLHDSSAALIPYLTGFKEPFVLLSTGTWCISLNPFDDNKLTADELQKDCLCYLTYEGKPVKASRLFGGNEHDQQAKRIAGHFNVPPDFYTELQLETEQMMGLRVRIKDIISENDSSIKFSFSNKDLGVFKNYYEAYLELMIDIITRQFNSTMIVVKKSHVKNIFVDGGFSQNIFFMKLLTEVFPKIKISSASVPQSSALGAALVIHKHWNKTPLVNDLVKLNRIYPSRHG